MAFLGHATRAVFGHRVLGYSQVLRSDSRYLYQVLSPLVADYVGGPYVYCIAFIVSKSMVMGRKKQQVILVRFFDKIQALERSHSGLVRMS